MAALIVRERPECVVEVGVYRGRSLVPQALALKHTGSGLVYAVDPWEPGPTQYGRSLPESEKWWAANDFEADYRFFMGALRQYGLGPFVEVLRTESADAAASFGPAPEVDVLHVDGNHSEEASLEDVAAWLPLVKPGGWVWLDDSDWPTVREAYRAVEAQCLKIADWDRYSLFRKFPVERSPEVG